MPITSIRQVRWNSTCPIVHHSVFSVHKLPWPVSFLHLVYGPAYLWYEQFISSLSGLKQNCLKHDVCSAVIFLKGHCHSSILYTQCLLLPLAAQNLGPSPTGASQPFVSLGHILGVNLTHGVNPTRKLASKWSGAAQSSWFLSEKNYVAKMYRQKIWDDDHLQKCVVRLLALDK